MALLPVEDALKLLLAGAGTLGAERVKLEQAAQRVLAEPHHFPIDIDDQRARTRGALVDGEDVRGLHTDEYTKLARTAAIISALPAL